MQHASPTTCSRGANETRNQMFVPHICKPSSITYTGSMFAIAQDILDNRMFRIVSRIPELITWKGKRISIESLLAPRLAN